MTQKWLGEKNEKIDVQEQRQNRKMKKKKDRKKGKQMKIIGTGIL